MLRSQRALHGGKTLEVEPGAGDRTTNDRTLSLPSVSTYRPLGQAGGTVNAVSADPTHWNPSQALEGSVCVVRFAVKPALWGAGVELTRCTVSGVAPGAVVLRKNWIVSPGRTDVTAG